MGHLTSAYLERLITPLVIWNKLDWQLFLQLLSEITFL